MGKCVAPSNECIGDNEAVVRTIVLSKLMLG